MPHRCDARSALHKECHDGCQQPAGMSNQHKHIPDAPVATVHGACGVSWSPCAQTAEPTGTAPAVVHRRAVHEGGKYEVGEEPRVVHSCGGYSTIHVR